MRNLTIKLRVTKIEKLLIEKKAKSTGLSISSYIRNLALGYEIKPLLTEHELDCYLTLSKYADNFRRISNLIKLGDVTGMKNETLETSKIIRQHLEKLKR